ESAEPVGKSPAGRGHPRGEGSQDQGAGLPREPVRRFRGRGEAHPRARRRARQADGLRLRGNLRSDRARAMSRYGPALVSVLLSLGAIASYVAFLRVPTIRNHPALYLVAFAVARAFAPAATWRAARSPTFAARGLSLLL